MSLHHRKSCRLTGTSRSRRGPSNSPGLYLGPETPDIATLHRLGLGLSTAPSQHNEWHHFPSARIPLCSEKCSCCCTRMLLWMGSSPCSHGGGSPAVRMQWLHRLAMVHSTDQSQCSGVCQSPSSDIQAGTQIYSWSHRQRQPMGVYSPWFHGEGLPGSGTAQLYTAGDYLSRFQRPNIASHWVRSGHSPQDS